MKYKASELELPPISLRRDHTVITSKDPPIEGEPGDVTIITAKLTVSSGPNVGAAIEGKTLHFLVDGVEKGTDVTDADGEASYGYTLVAGDDGNIPLIKYLGD